MTQHELGGYLDYGQPQVRVSELERGVRRPERGRAAALGYARTTGTRRRRQRIETTKAPGHHSTLPDFSELSATEALAVVVTELRGVRLELARLGAVERELARLRDAVRRPERVIYRPKELARRLGFKSEKTIQNLWNDGKLGFHKDRRGRYSTEAQVQAYERDWVQKHDAYVSRWR